MHFTLMSEEEKPILQHLPSFSLQESENVLTVIGYGNWTVGTIGDVEPEFSRETKNYDYNKVRFDFGGITKLDTAGAYALARAIRCEPGRCHEWDIASATSGKRTLIAAAADAVMGRPPREPRPWYELFSRLGQAVTRACSEAYDTVAFTGKFFTVLIASILNPSRFRWKAIVALIEDVGLNAAPIIMLLSFFIGAVIAFMGANLLAAFGAQIFMVDLVGFSVLREFAVLITAIMLAGRSDSSFTAQIGAMKMRQEVDAMQVIGLDRFETLVIPRAIACLVSAPILTFAAMMSGLAGGMIVAWLGPTDISPILFFARMRESVEINNFWVGIIKAPFFALIIAIIGCRQGLAVTGSVESLGSRTTSSVVQAIFSVIVMDAIFAMLFLEMGV